MKSSPTIRVLIVDDHPVVRAGLRVITEVDPGILVIGEAGSGAEAIVAVRESMPDVVLLDVRLPDRNGIDVCRELKSQPKAPRILFLTSFADNALVLAAMQAGGDGYLLKDNEPRDIVAAIRTVLAGGMLFDPVVARAVDRELRSTLPGNSPDPLGELSQQERRVVSAVADGKTDKEIAQMLKLQPKTVRNYLDRAFEKLGVHTRTEAAILFDRHRRP
ncbi:MAG: response regulator transcription factor [Verrucomicrobiota bacterium]|nr:response regulator transcription factor [Verrucomicrobiota bacterium]